MTQKSILIIDDDPDIIASLKIILKTADYEALSANSVDNAVKLLSSLQKEEKKPDMIICDMMMEEIDAGKRFAGKVKDEFSDIPVLLLSSIGDETEQNVNIYDMGFCGVCQKPVNPSHLLNVIKNTIS